MGSVRLRSRLLLLAALAGLATAQDARADVGTAREALREGRYPDAASALSAEDASSEADALRVQLALVTGRYDDAAALAETLIGRSGAGAREARLLAARAHTARGRYAEARRQLAPLVQSEDPEALDLAAVAAEAAGDHAGALRAQRALIGAYNDGRAESAGALLGVARAAYALGAFKDANRAFGEAARKDPHDVQVQLAWAELFLRKYAADQAGACMKDALAINPHHPEVLELKARLEYEYRLDFAKAEALLDEALATNPSLTRAHVTRGAIALRDHALDDALAHIDRALAINPKDLEALSLKAAVYFVDDDDAAFEKAVRTVLAIDRRFSRVYSIVARYAEWEHRYADLVTLADRALKLRPEDADAHATRGLNLLRTGRQKEGLAALHEAWRLDRYNERVFNTLNLYDDVIVPEYVDYAEGRYRIRTHRDERAVLEPYVGPLLEEGFAQMRTHYGISPNGPLWFEIYARPEHFSVRTTGMPRVGVQGVCFGNVVTAISPMAGPINWAQILWHEQAHIFHIALSNNRVPRWFTEGLAEYETIIARPEWQREDDEALLDALERGSLAPILQLNEAFTHARSPAEVMVAYYASSRVVSYLVERFGFAKVPAMLKAWGRGLDTAEVFERVLGVTPGQLDSDFRESELSRLSKLRAQFRVRLEDYASLGEWRERVARKPSAEAEAGLAAAELLRGQLPLANRHAQRALELEPSNRLALYVQVQAAFRQGSDEDAARALAALYAAGADGYALRLLSARLAIKAHDFAAARSELERAIALSPDEGEAYVALEVVADGLGDLRLRADAGLALSRIDQHGTGPLLMTLPLLADQKRFEELAQLFEHGKNLVPQSSLLHRFGARAADSLGQHARALTLAERAVSLAKSPEERASALIERARAERSLGRTEAARASAAQATKLVPALGDAAQRALSR